LTLAVNPLLTSTQNITVCANQLPYTWLGHVFNGAATITDTVAGNNSCDTIRTLTLAVNPLLTSTQNITVCANQLPYTWLGHVFNGAATITDTVAGNNSCDTIRTLTLAVNPLLTSTQNITVCANQLPYTWLGHVFNRGSDDHGYSCGQQQLRYNKNIDTCRKSAADINTKHHGSVQSQLPYTWLGHVFNGGSDDHGYSCGQQQLRYNKNIDTCRKSAADINTKHHGLCKPVTVYMVGSCVSPEAATITDTVAGNNSCDTIRTLTLAVNPLLTSTQNITVCASQLPYTWLGHVFNGAATITDTVAGNNSCDTIRTLTLAGKSAADINTKHHGLCEASYRIPGWVMCSTGQRRSRIQLRATTVAIQ
jgi:peptide methionine sulfoxide reductase MsrB